MEHPNSLSRLLEQKKQSGASILDLTQSNPTRAGLDYPHAALLDAFQNPEALSYQPVPQGLPHAREAIAGYYAERDIEIHPHRLLLTASTSEAYSYLFKLLCDPGDEILTPRPSYPLFEYLAGLESVAVRQYSLVYDGHWHIDFAALESQVTPRSRAIVVVNPNNPTGSYLKKDELDRLESLAAERDIALISDEVFSDYAFDANPSRITSLIGPRRALTFSMSGLSKIAGLPQMKLGWIAANGPESDAALQRLELIADTFLSVGAPVQAALPGLLRGGHQVQQQIRVRTAGNLEVLRRQMSGTPASVLAVEGGWYAVLQVPRVRSEEEWTLGLLETDNVLVQPGFFFDFETEAFLVVSLLTQSEIFRAGIGYLHAWL